MQDFENRGSSSRNAIWLIVIVVVALFGFVIYKGWGKAINSEIDKKVVVTGEFTCLPVKEGGAPQRGCVLGVKSNGGEYYALDISRIQDANRDLKADDTIAVTGTLEPESEIPTSDWAEYDIAGIILVNTLLRTR